MRIFANLAHLFMLFMLQLAHTVNHVSQDANRKVDFFGGGKVGEYNGVCSMRILSIYVT